MRHFGIVRRIDSLGRIVIPIELRRTAHIHVGDALEIYTDKDDEIVLKKYSYLTELGSIAKEYAESLYFISEIPVIVCDCDHVIAAAGLPSGELIKQRVSPALDALMLERVTVTGLSDDSGKWKPASSDGIFILAGMPIVVNSEVCGYIMFAAAANDVQADDDKLKLMQLTVALLEKRME